MGSGYEIVKSEDIFRGAQAILHRWSLVKESRTPHFIHAFKEMFSERPFGTLGYREVSGIPRKSRDERLQVDRISYEGIFKRRGKIKLSYSLGPSGKINDFIDYRCNEVRYKEDTSGSLYIVEILSDGSQKQRVFIKG